ncbi:MAG TPA: EamA/RhaT family transporter, partial [Ottowia sp.]|nr:EamA/RhaT family transporter [Ottowia sp.]
MPAARSHTATANLLALATIALWASLAALGTALAHVPPFLLTGLGLLAG